MSLLHLFIYFNQVRTPNCPRRYVSQIVAVPHTIITCQFYRTLLLVSGSSIERCLLLEEDVLSTSAHLACDRPDWLQRQNWVAMGTIDVHNFVNAALEKNVLYITSASSPSVSTCTR